MASVIVCDWIPPAFGAVGQYMDQRAHRLAAAGEDVVLIGLAETASVETRSSLTIVRLAANKPAKTASILRRGLWALGVNRRLLGAVARALSSIPEGEGDIVVTGSPPFLSYLIILVNRFVWRRTVVYRITDFYPETLFAAGHFGWLKWLQAPFHALRRGADRIEALGEDQKRRLVESGMPADRIVVVRDASPVSPGKVKPAASPFARAHVTLLYSGNLGLAHELPTLTAAYALHHREGSGRVRLWLNGQGARVGELTAFCETQNLPLHHTPPAALEDLPSVLAAADAHLVLLREAFWGYVLPSKIYACLEREQPLLYIGPPQSDVHMLSQARGGQYHHIAPGDVAGAVAALEALADRVLAGRRK